MIFQWHLKRDGFQILQEAFCMSDTYISEKKIRKLDDGWVFPVPHRTSILLSNISNKDFAMAMFKDGERDFESEKS